MFKLQLVSNSPKYLLETQKNDDDMARRDTAVENDGCGSSPRQTARKGHTKGLGGGVR